MVYNISNVFIEFLDETNEGETVNSVFNDFIDGSMN